MLCVENTIQKYIIIEKRTGSKQKKMARYYSVSNVAGTTLCSKDQTPDKVPDFVELESNVEERRILVSVFHECQSMNLEFSSCRCKHSSLLPLLRVLAQIPSSHGGSS